MAQIGTIAYAVVEEWEQLPPGYARRDVAGVAVDGKDRVYLICRGEAPGARLRSAGQLSPVLG